MQHQTKQILTLKSYSYDYRSTRSKGLVAIGHFVAAHATAGTVAAAAHAVAGMSLAQIATATVTAGFVAGCITWTGDRIKNVQNGIKGRPWKGAPRQ